MYLKELQATFARLSQNPELGRQRQELKPGVFSWLHHKHIIFYQLHEKGLIVLRVLHQSRDIDEL